MANPEPVPKPVRIPVPVITDEEGNDEQTGQQPITDGLYPNDTPEVGFIESLGVWWPLHCYGLGCLFLVAGFYALRAVVLLVSRQRRSASAPNPFVIAINALALSTCLSRALFLLVDPYYQTARLPLAVNNLLFNLPFPCMTSALAMILWVLNEVGQLRLSARSRSRKLRALYIIIASHFGVVLIVCLVIEFTDSQVLLIVGCHGFFVIWGLYLCGAAVHLTCKINRLVTTTVNTLMSISNKGNSLASAAPEKPNPIYKPPTSPKGEKSRGCRPGLQSSVMVQTISSGKITDADPTLLKIDGDSNTDSPDPPSSPDLPRTVSVDKIKHEPFSRRLKINGLSHAFRNVTLIFRRSASESLSQERACTPERNGSKEKLRETSQLSSSCDRPALNGNPALNEVATPVISLPRPGLVNEKPYKKKPSAPMSVCERESRRGINRLRQKSSGSNRPALGDDARMKAKRTRKITRITVAITTTSVAACVLNFVFILSVIPNTNVLQTAGVDVFSFWTLFRVTEILMAWTMLYFTAQPLPRTTNTKRSSLRKFFTGIKGHVSESEVTLPTSTTGSIKKGGNKP